MEYLEASRRIANHLQVHKFKEQPRCEKITEALTLAISTLEQYDRTKEVIAQYMGLPMECRCVRPDTVIVLRFELFKHDLEMVKRAFESIKQEFPNNTVIVLPKSMELEHFTRESLVALKTQLDAILEEAAV